MPTKEKNIKAKIHTCDYFYEKVQMLNRKKAKQTKGKEHYHK